MDQEILERLIMDRALGALSADADALLTAYLQMHPECAEMDQQMAQTVQLVRTVMPIESVPLLPPFPTNRIGKLVRRQRRLWQYGYAAAMAACVLLGVGLGSVVFHGTPQTPGLQPSSIVIYQMPERQSASEVVEDAGFWSTKRLREEYENASKVRSSSSYLIWDSPLALPRRGGSL